jgi:hypothetical protein
MNIILNNYQVKHCLFLKGEFNESEVENVLPITLRTHSFFSSLTRCFSLKKSDLKLFYSNDYESIFEVHITLGFKSEVSTFIHTLIF